MALNESEMREYGFDPELAFDLHSESQVAAMVAEQFKQEEQKQDKLNEYLDKISPEKADERNAVIQRLSKAAKTAS
eukprot:CAMPEP_0185572758 /NCGR_PEP_ID=MMETSP0434-20130131/4631_1 /TAXON_ID=626734 ORGANISM="Favella taraikaensis, Strain Fe Narragansett Bay" /NCGR_SAMPLE_ID=MMETSP0434 /ASSEMBLY_ACC=CAM_ASM_000379 /LENGTH=75 /DNA_ID=CAMNT_0028188743 /DNA_START=368 /DNA_END=595 /DNA_ORIENTATION=+